MLKEAAREVYWARGRALRAVGLCRTKHMYTSEMQCSTHDLVEALAVRTHALEEALARQTAKIQLVKTLGRVQLAGLAPSNPHARDCARLVCLDSLASFSLSFLAIVKGGDGTSTRRTVCEMCDHRRSPTLAFVTHKMTTRGHICVKP